MWWPDALSALASRCPSCGGTVLRAHEVDDILGAQLGYSIAELRAGARETTSGRGACPSCGGDMRPLQIEGTALDLCLRCGSAWLDAGELEHLTHGRIAEARPPDEQARAYMPAGVAPTGQRRYVRVPEVSLRRRALAAGLFAGGAFGLLVPALGIPLLFAGVGVAQVRGVLFDTVQRRLKSVLTLFPARGRFRPWTDFSQVVVRRRIVGARAAPATDRWSAWLDDVTHDAPGVTIAEGRSRVLAHRWAFQVSQLTGLRVYAPDDDDDDD